MPKYCRAPNCSSTAGRLGSDNRPVSFYKFPLKDGPRLQAWLHHMGCEHWVPSCHQHLCSEHFTLSCFQWRWGVRYLWPDAVPSIFSRASPDKRQQTARSTKKPMLPPQQPACAASGPVRCVVLGPTSRGPEAVTTVLLTPSSLPSASAGQRPGDLAQHPQAVLRATLGALQQRVSKLQRRQELHQAQLRALEQLAQQLCRESLLVRARRGPLCLALHPLPWMPGLSPWIPGCPVHKGWSDDVKGQRQKTETDHHTRHLPGPVAHAWAEAAPQHLGPTPPLTDPWNLICDLGLSYLVALTPLECLAFAIPSSDP